MAVSGVPQVTQIASHNIRTGTDVLSVTRHVPGLVVILLLLTFVCYQAAGAQDSTQPAAPRSTAGEIRTSPARPSVFFSLYLVDSAAGAEAAARVELELSWPEAASIHQLRTYSVVRVDQLPAPLASPDYWHALISEELAQAGTLYEIVDWRGR